MMYRKITESLILERLPNEAKSQILVAILDHLPLKALLKATLICRRIHLLAVHTLQRRLLAISSHPGHHEVILECYHPSLKISTPYLSCRPLGTRHPNDCAAAAAAAAATRQQQQGEEQEQEQEEAAPPPSLGHVCQLYASFLPVVTEENRRRRFRNMAWPVSVRDGPPVGADEMATQELPFDDGALFSQLCVALNLVTPHGRHRGVFVSHYNMSEHVVRVFRRWLEQGMAGDDGERAPWDPTAPPPPPPPPPLASSRILWVDEAQTIGLRFRVSLGPAERMPLLSGTDEEPAVSYTLTYQELLIRSTSLLMAVEASANKEMEPSQNSIILSSAVA
ncbi:Cyclin-like F-box [Beauveria brongniartii RCEF 3172]|uniref:Cyclin-like F-box n=1 Tax=Beauveria brongniartii RCEF 3172 TaxID=1081107 RepID=A0A167DIN4_9HYPO|nr:Cyclin-like F-box [Beauveria brongniartii RCEF 3172]